VKVVAVVSFAHQTVRTPKIFSVVAPCSLAGSYQMMLLSTLLQWLDQGDRQQPYHHLENLRSHFMTLNKSLKSQPKSD